MISEIYAEFLDVLWNVGLRPVDTCHILNIVLNISHMKVLCTFNLRCISAGKNKDRKIFANLFFFFLLCHFIISRIYLFQNDNTNKLEDERNAGRFLKYVWSFWDVMYEKVIYFISAPRIQWRWLVHLVSKLWWKANRNTKVFLRNVWG